jgi:hypothetical protein
MQNYKQHLKVMLQDLNSLRKEVVTPCILKEIDRREGELILEYLATK